MNKVLLRLPENDRVHLNDGKIPDGLRAWLKDHEQDAKVHQLGSDTVVMGEESNKRWHIRYGTKAGDEYTLEYEEPHCNNSLHNPRRVLKEAVTRLVRKLSRRNIPVYYPRGSRSYQTTVLPTLRSGRTGPGSDFSVLEMLYSELSNNWRQLTDVRFKLLALVPAVSLLVLVGLLGPDTTRQDRIDPASGEIIETTITTKQSLDPLVKFVIAALGLAVTSGLYIYEIRNSDLYNDLTSRGRAIEKELGVDTGIFLGRPSPEKKLLWIIPGKTFLIQHSLAIQAIYWSSILGWILALAYLASR